MGLFEFIAKSRSGVYKDTPENRRLHRVGQRYGALQRKNDEVMIDGELIPGMPNSTKVNLSKYLSGKMKAEADRIVGKVKSSPELWNDSLKLKSAIDTYKKIFNSLFDELSKAKRALYVEIVKQLSSRLDELGGVKEKNVLEPEKKTVATVDDKSGGEESNSIFEQAIKAKGIVHGEPMEPLEADEHNANPNYGKAVNGSYRAYTHNCQTCVVAYELRRRGYDVEAQGVNPRSGYFNDFQYKMACNSATSFQDRVDFVYLATGKRNTENNRRTFIDTIVRAVMTKGEGRYFLSFKNRKRNSGHIVVIERMNESCVLMDPQSGKICTLKYSFGEEPTLAAMKYFESVDITHPMNKMFKVDGLEFKPEVLDLMIPKDRKE